MDGSRDLSIVALAMLSASARVSAEFAPTTPTLARAPISPSAVDVLLGNASARPYVELGVLSLAGIEPASLSVQIATLRAEAAARGCQLVVVKPPATLDDGSWRVTATCAVYGDTAA